MPVLRTVRVSGVPDWVDHARLLGPGSWRRCGGSEPDDRTALEAQLSLPLAADVEARLRGVGLGGTVLQVDVRPPLPRPAVRAARLAEARRQRQRGLGFERRGTWLDADSRRGLTPEALALRLGRRARRVHVLDACAGAGGNAIGFARAGCRVTALELDPQRLAQARHNAACYGVAERIRFIAGDARERLSELRADLLFIDPPWGVHSGERRVALEDLPLLAALLPQARRFSRTWLKVPASFDPAGVPEARPEAWFGSGRGDARRVKFLLLVL